MQSCYCTLIAKVLWLKRESRFPTRTLTTNIYIKRFKSDWEASGQFISDESLLSEKNQSSKLKKHWSDLMALLRIEGQQANLTDVLTRLWIKSDPLVHEELSTCG